MKQIDGNITCNKSISAEIGFITPIIESAILGTGAIDASINTSKESMSAVINAIDTYAITSGATTEYEEGDYIPNEDDPRPTIYFKRIHNETPFLAVISDTTGVFDSTSQTMYSGVFFDFYRAFGVPIPYTPTSNKYGIWYYIYRGNYASGFSFSAAYLDHAFEDTDQFNSTHPRYYCTESFFRPYSFNPFRYFRKNRTYKWYAIWRCKDG